MNECSVDNEEVDKFIEYDSQADQSNMSNQLEFYRLGDEQIAEQSADSEWHSFSHQDGVAYFTQIRNERIFVEELFKCHLITTAKSSENLFFET